MEAVMALSLFDKVQLGNTTLKNRLVRSATWEGMCEESGAVTDKLTDYYRILAEGGVGLIISGYSFVRADGKQLSGKMGIHDDTMIEGLRHLTEAVHKTDSKIFCQLVHAGGQTSGKVIGCQPIAPSAVDFPSYGETPREMSEKDIDEIVQAFAAAAWRAEAAGFDGVQIHGAHGYLVNQFLSPLTNRRKDQYGGCLENRMRFLVRVCEAIKSVVRPGFPISIKLTATDHLEGGFAVEEAVLLAKHLEKLGLTSIEVSSGTPASGEMSPVRQKISTQEQEAYNADYANRIKASVDIPVMTVGGLRSGDVLHQRLWDSSADLFSLSRPLIREPDLPKKWFDNDTYTCTCISCNGCFRPGLKGEGIFCIVDKVEEATKDVII
jgi:2,4-dienoyl-CoA reductase-like NADH-dependent reductase (Old Yellow Enzyme family)